MTIQEQQAEK